MMCLALAAFPSHWFCLLLAPSSIFPAIDHDERQDSSHLVDKSIRLKHYLRDYEYTSSVQDPVSC